MADDIQSEDLVKADLRRQEALEAERAPFEATYRDAEVLCDPMAAGAFSGQQIGPQRNYNFDSTAIEGLDRFDATLGAVTMPKTERWLGATVYDKDLARCRPCNAGSSITAIAFGIACTRRTPRSASPPARIAARSAATAPRRCGSTKPRAAGCSSARCT
jgi:hypothetical protein